MTPRIFWVEHLDGGGMPDEEMGHRWFGEHRFQEVKH